MRKPSPVCVDILFESIAYKDVEFRVADHQVMCYSYCDTGSFVVYVCKQQNR